MGLRAHAALHPLTYVALRLALAAPTTVGIGQSLETARSLGRAFGSARFNRKRRERAANALQIAFPDWSREQAERHVLLSYEHLAQLAVEVAFTPQKLNEEAWLRHIELDNVGVALRALLEDNPMVAITGHCGNWELLGYQLALLGYPLHALYRPLDNAPMDAWLRSTRARRGMTLVDKFGAVQTLPRLLEQRVPVAFVADQNAGDRGLFVPYFNRLASTYKSIGLLVLQQRATVVVAGARRLGWDGEHWGREQSLGYSAGYDGDGFRYRIEIVDTFGPKDWESHPDPLFYISARYRHGLERLVSSAPEQYLWMHRMWKSRPRHERLDRPFPDSMREKLEALPWLSDEDVAGLMDRSDRDRAFLKETGRDRLP